MNKDRMRDLLYKIGIDISGEQLEKFDKYYIEMMIWNEKCNLTAITEESEVIIKHFYDSLLVMLFQEWKGEGRLLDIGTGAGLPGLPIKIMNTDMHITLMDSLNKRIKFLEHIINIFKLSGIEAIHARAEELGQDVKWRERFDIVVSRAVARMTVLLEYCLPFVKTGGFFIAYKGPDAEEEITAAKKAFEILGGKIKRIEKHELPEGGGKRSLILIEKINPTPKVYPRKAGTPEKKPL